MAAPDRMRPQRSHGFATTWASPSTIELCTHRRSPHRSRSGPFSPAATPPAPPAGTTSATFPRSAAPSAGPGSSSRSPGRRVQEAIQGCESGPVPDAGPVDRLDAGIPVVSGSFGRAVRARAPPVDVLDLLGTGPLTFGACVTGLVLIRRRRGNRTDAERFAVSFALWLVVASTIARVGISHPVPSHVGRDPAPVAWDAVTGSAGALFAGERGTHPPRGCTGRMRIFARRGQGAWDSSTWYKSVPTSLSSPFASIVCPRPVTPAHGAIEPATRPT